MGKIIKIKKPTIIQNEKAMQVNNELTPPPGQSSSVPNPSDSIGSDQNSNSTTGSIPEDSLNFLNLMMKNTSKCIEFLCINPNEKAKDKIKDRLWLRDENKIETFLKKHNGVNHIFFGAATRIEGGGKKSDCREVPWLWADIDFKDFPNGENEARTRLESFQFQPTIIVYTGGGLHVYWILESIADSQTSMKNVERALKILAHQLNADPNRTDITSKLRVPGTINMKPERNGAICKIESINCSNRISLEEILSLDGPTKTSPHKTLEELEKEIEIGNRDSGTLAYINACVKASGKNTNDALLELKVYGFLDKAGGEGIDAIKKKVPEWILSAHELFDQRKKPTSLNLADNFIKSAGGNLIYTEGGFFQYMEGYWKNIKEGQLKRRFAEMDLPYTSRERTGNALEILRDLTYCDRPTPTPGLLCLKNGTLRLDTGEIVPHSPKHYLFNKLETDWDPHATCDLWYQTLNEIFRDDPDKKEKILFLQELFGYCLVPETWLHKFVLMVGSGANGKSLILEILTAVIGEKNISHAMLTRLGKECVRAELLNKLVNISTEMQAESTLSSGYLKALVSGDPLEARFNYGRSFSFRPHARIICATNELPRLLDFTEGFRRRVVILRFNRTFKEHEQDKHRKEKLLAELPGIFRWTVEGLKRLRKNDGFTIPPSSRYALAEYMQESDPIQLFAKEELEHDVSGNLSSTPLYQIYATWASQRGFQKLNIINFGKRLKSLGFKKRKTNGKQVWCAKLKSTTLPHS